jgi:hypothetical protein
VPRLGGFLLPSDLDLVDASGNRVQMDLVEDGVKTHQRSDQRTISERRLRCGMVRLAFRQEA